MFDILMNVNISGTVSVGIVTAKTGILIMKIRHAMIVSFAFICHRFHVVVRGLFFIIGMG